MTSLVRVLNVALRVIAGAALILGIAFWFGLARALTVWHMVLGTALILCLWVLAGVVWMHVGRTGLVALAVAWGLFTWAFGVVHAAILPGPWHWLVAVSHPAAGVLCVVIGGQLATAYFDHRSVR
jgi:hypothetical protein